MLIFFLINENICTPLGDVMKESAQIALNWIRSNDHRVSDISYGVNAEVVMCHFCIVWFTVWSTG